MKRSFNDMTKREKRFVVSVMGVVAAALIFGLWYTSPKRLYPEICGVKEPPRWCMD